MATIDVARGGHFKIGGTRQVNRLGFGAMRITGDGIWGPPKNLDEAKRVLARLPELGIDFIDTADSYGPAISENLIAEVLAPYTNVFIATKGGLTRPGPNQWIPNGRPDHLRKAVKESLQRLKLERLPLWQLHRIDTKVPRDEQLGVIAEMQKAGLIEHVGLSEVSVGDIEAASRFFEVATVQNQYNIIDRKSEAVLDYCTEHGIGFIPWYPLAAGVLAEPGGVVDQVARKLDATPSQIALAWLLARSPVMLPIPGTGSVRHLEENCAAVTFTLAEEDFDAIDRAGRAAS